MTECDMGRGHILVVEDDQANRMILNKILTRAGYDILEAADGLEALGLIRKTSPDLIFMDIMMPKMDGLEVCRQIKADEETRDIPIIFLTAVGELGRKMEAFAAGGADYIIKPFQVEEVLARARTHMTVRRLQRDLKDHNVLLQSEIGERRRTEAELQASQAALRQHASELEAQNAELDAFAHTVAHDLKNSLNAIVGYSDLLERHGRQMPAEDTLRYLRTISQTGHKMARIVDELLLLASVRKMGDVKTAALDMARIVDEAQSRLADLIASSGAEMAAPAHWPAAAGYAPWVEEVWANLISNGLKYGGRPDAGLPPQLELGADGQAGQAFVRFWVRDRGMGLTPEQQAVLFTPFTRLVQMPSEGHGLGLSIVRRIIDKLGGEVGVQSEVGRGSAFWFTLPAVPDERGGRE